MVLHMPISENLATEEAYYAKRRAIALDEGTQVAMNEVHKEQLAHDEARDRQSGARCLGLAILLAAGMAAAALVVFLSIFLGGKL